MKKSHAWWASLVIGAGATPAAWAQVPPVPPGAAGAAVTAAPAAAPTLWGFLGCTPEAKEACKRHLCTLQCGQMLNNATAPMGAITGGLIPPLCPTTPTAKELAEPGAVGAAAAVKADEAAAKERRAAVRYLGTVDCHYWPEAQDALIAALRSDRNECVRYEAALAFLNGCCCTKATIEALTIVITCNEAKDGPRDGFPKETSARVHGAARMALERCLSCYVPPPEPKKEPVTEGAAKPKTEQGVIPQGHKEEKKGEEPKKLAAVRPVGKAYYDLISKQPLDAIVRESRRALMMTQASYAPGASGMSLSKLFDRSAGGSEIRGYVVHDSKPGANVVIKEKPTNLWDMVVHNTRPVTVTSAPAPRMESMVRLTPQANHATVMPATMPTAAAAGMQPVLRSEPRALPATPVVTTPPVAVQPSAPVAAPPAEIKPVAEQRLVVDPKPMPEQKPVAVSTPVQQKLVVEQRMVVEPKPVIATKPVPMPVEPKPAPMPAEPKLEAAPKQPMPKPEVAPKQEMPKQEMQKQEASKQEAPKQDLAPKAAAPAGMSDADRVAALNAIQPRHGSPEVGRKLLLLAQMDKCEEVRCAAIRATVRTQVAPEVAIPVLAELGMNPASVVGKCANEALMQINLQAAGGAK